MSNFTKRAYGFVVIKAINANYNADFTGQPRTLPNGQVYATDKALKFTVRHYIKENFPEQKVFIYKRLKEEGNPYTLVEAYNSFFNADAKEEKKEEILFNLLSAIDVRLFGATFAPKGEGVKDKNISIHGPVQINHGVNIWGEGNIYSEQILSPFRNPSESKKDEEKAQSTLGRQSRLEEGHYLHHFSINPKNLEEVVRLGKNGTQTLTEKDILLLKEALRKGATYYDSTSKAGVENEILFYVELKEGSKIVLPNFTQMVRIKDTDQEKKCFDLMMVNKELSKYNDDIERVEIYYDPTTTCLENLPEKCKEFDLISGDKLNE